MSIARAIVGRAANPRVRNHLSARKWPARRGEPDGCEGDRSEECGLAPLFRESHNDM
jgi:hypothetical protein